jgi:hypothetical protein
LYEHCRRGQFCSIKVRLMATVMTVVTFALFTKKRLMVWNQVNPNPFWNKLREETKKKREVGLSVVFITNNEKKFYLFFYVIIVMFFSLFIKNTYLFFFSFLDLMPDSFLFIRWTKKSKRSLTASTCPIIIRIFVKTT